MEKQKATLTYHSLSLMRAEALSRDLKNQTWWWVRREANAKGMDQSLRAGMGKVDWWTERHLCDVGSIFRGQ